MQVRPHHNQLSSTAEHPRGCLWSGRREPMTPKLQLLRPHLRSLSCSSPARSTLLGDPIADRLSKAKELRLDQLVGRGLNRRISALMAELSQKLMSELVISCPKIEHPPPTLNRRKKMFVRQFLLRFLSRLVTTRRVRLSSALSRAPYGAPKRC